MAEGGGFGSGTLEMDEDLKASLDRNWSTLDMSFDDDDEDEESALKPVKEEEQANGVDKALDGGGGKEPEPSEEAELVAESGLHFDSAGRPEWFFLQARAGMEDRVRASIEGMVRGIPHVSSKVADVIVPRISVMQLSSSGKTVHKDDRMFPGYLLIYMVMDFSTWREISNVPYVHCFVGDTNQKDFKGSFQKPPAVPKNVIKDIFHRLSDLSEKGVENPIMSRFLPGNRVAVVAGPLSGQEGRIVKVIPEQGVATVKVFVHNRITEEEVLFAQMEVVQKSEDEDPDELDELLGQVDAQKNVNVKKMRRRNRDFKKGDSVVVTSGPYGGCTGNVKTTLPRQNKVTVLIKMFNRSLQVKLPYEQVRLEDEDDDGNPLQEDASSEFVEAETVSEGRADAEAAVNAASSSLDTLVRGLEGAEMGAAEEDPSDELFLEKIDASFQAEAAAAAPSRVDGTRDVVSDVASDAGREPAATKSWFSRGPKAEGGEDAGGHSDELPTDDLFAFLSKSKPQSDDGFVEDEIIEDADDDSDDFDLESILGGTSADDDDEDDGGLSILDKIEEDLSETDPSASSGAVKRAPRKSLDDSLSWLLSTEPAPEGPSETAEEGDSGDAIDLLLDREGWAEAEAAGNLASEASDADAGGKLGSAAPAKHQETRRGSSSPAQTTAMDAADIAAAAERSKAAKLARKVKLQAEMKKTEERGLAGANQPDDDGALDWLYMDDSSEEDQKPSSKGKGRSDDLI